MEHRVRVPDQVEEIQTKKTEDLKDYDKKDPDVGSNVEC